MLGKSFELSGVCETNGNALDAVPGDQGFEPFIIGLVNQAGYQSIAELSLYDPLLVGTALFGLTHYRPLRASSSISLLM
jgi:hypothetical protein